MHLWKRWAAMAMAALCLSPGARAGTQTLAQQPLLALVSDAASGTLYQLDGQTFDLLRQITLPYPLHEPVAVAPDGRHAFLSSPQGLVIRLDLRSGQTTLVQVARETAALALSHDGRYLMAANRAPATLVALDAGSMSVLRVLEAQDRQGKASPVVALHTVAARKSFVAVMGAIPELWELSYDERAEAVFDGLVHDYKMGEGLALQGPFPPRRTVLEQALAHFFFDQAAPHAIGAGAGGLLQVIHLDIRRKIGELQLDGMAQPDQGIRMEWMGRPVLLLPQADGPLLSVLDLQSWQVLRQFGAGAGRQRLFSHEQARYVWAVAEDGAVQILDKQSLTFVSGIDAMLAGASAPLAWTPDGHFAVLRARQAGGALLVCDARSLKIVKRLPLP